MTLVEVLVTSLVLVCGLMTTMSVFASSGRTTVGAERKAAMTAVAQRELEKLRPLPYERVGLTGAPAAGAPSPGANAAAEPPTLGGVIAPGPETFSVNGVSGKVYRFVSWRAQTCPLVNSRVSTRVANTLGITAAAVNARVGDLCQGEHDTKRITVVVVPDLDEGSGGPRRPVRMSSLLVDPERGVINDPDGKGLRVDVDAANQTLSPSGQPSPETVHETSVEQHLFLYDTPCDQSARQAVTVSHPRHDTSRSGSTCATTARADLMAFSAPPGDPASTLFDYSNEFARNVPGGRSVKRDDRNSGCGTDYTYSAADADRRSRSLHTWASRPISAPAETAVHHGRATITLFTSTSDGSAKGGRVCVTLWQRSTGTVIGKADYSLPAWPEEPTGLSLSFETQHLNFAAGERLMLTVRVPESSAADLSFFYDHAAYPSSLSVATERGGELR